MKFGTQVLPQSGKKFAGSFPFSLDGSSLSNHLFPNPSCRARIDRSCMRKYLILIVFLCAQAALIAQSALTSPTPGSVLTGSTVTFTWSATGAKGYSLWLGSKGVGSNNLFHSGESLATSFTAAGLPTDGETIYAQLNTYVNGAVTHLDYTYTAVTLAPAALTSPAPGSTLPGSTVTFNWSTDPGASGYSLWLGSKGVGTSNLYHSPEGTTTSLTVSGLPTNGETIYARINSMIDGALQHVDYTYTASNSLGGVERTDL